MPELSPGETGWALEPWGHREPRDSPRDPGKEGKSCRRAVLRGREAAQERLPWLRAQLCPPQLEQSHFSPLHFDSPPGKRGASPQRDPNSAPKLTTNPARDQLVHTPNHGPTLGPSHRLRPCSSPGCLGIKPKSPGGAGRRCSPFLPPRGKGRAVTDVSPKQSSREIASGVCREEITGGDNGRGSHIPEQSKTTAGAAVSAHNFLSLAPFYPHSSCTAN